MNKTHIPLFFIILAAPLCFSCHTEDTPSTSSGGNDFTALTTPYAKGSTKTVVEEFDPLWSAGDRLTVWGSDLVPRQCQTLDHDSCEAGFRYLERPDEAVGGSFTAIYPADLFRSPTRILLPPSQKSQTGKLSNAPMYATSSTSHLQFENLCGAVRIRLTGQNAKRIFYIILMADRRINGEFDLVGAADGGCPTLSHASGGGNNSILQVTNAAQGDGSYYIALPAGTYEKLSAYLYTVDRTSTSVSLTHGEPITIQQNAIASFTFNDVVFN